MNIHGRWVLAASVTVANHHLHQLAVLSVFMPQTSTWLGDGSSLADRSQTCDSLHFSLNLEYFAEQLMKEHFGFRLRLHCYRAEWRFALRCRLKIFLLIFCGRPLCVFKTSVLLNVAVNTDTNTAYQCAYQCANSPWNACVNIVWMLRPCCSILLANTQGGATRRISSRSYSCTIYTNSPSASALKSTSLCLPLETYIFQIM